ncbi:Hypothetical predicted protein [Paramuricea clavata]|uniref:Uncharacterized protein n=1 Tax=Paramuricea clavata TaxID=317549 RepID=A0A7D9IL26_PARCT|nr:Hypothetical predicted protein [Paramuricea clavata]
MGSGTVFFPLIDGKNIDDLKVVDLKKALGLRGLKKSGLKGELKERLRQDIISHSVESLSDTSISSEEHNGTSTILPNLPSFKPINHSSGKAGKEFIKLQSQWLSKFNNEDSFMGISLKVFMTLPMILLQKPSVSSKAKEHSQALSRRIKWLKDGELQRLLSECRSIQHQLRPKTSSDNLSKTFAKLIMMGNVNAALRLLSEESDGCVLPLSEEVLRNLQEKHPAPADIQPSSLLHGPIIDLRNISIAVDEQTILTAAKTLKGAAGPSGLDANQYIRMLCSKQFHREGKCLREQIALFAVKIATESLDPFCLEAYVANRLIPLDKSPGIRPIGIGEIMRRLVGKALTKEFKQDFKEATGPIQVCAGHEAGAEAAIHAMQQVWEEKNTEGILLIDASNAFNSLNRQVALHNILLLCPRPAISIINTYRNPARLFIVGGGELRSQEGTTQGEPLAMPFYAISVMVLISFLHDAYDMVKQVWFADNSTAAGKLRALLAFFEMLISEGVKYGYHVNSGKSWLVIKNPCDIERATELFKSHDIKITSDGHRLLGAVIGSTCFREEYVNSKVSTWCTELENLCSIAKSQPHAAYAAFVQGYKHKFTFYIRTIPNVAHLFQPVEEIICSKFLPTIFGQDISQLDRETYALPIRNGGLGIPRIPEDADFERNTSKLLCGPLSALIIIQACNQLPQHDEITNAKSQVRSLRVERATTSSLSVDIQLSQEQHRTISLARDKGASGWLNVLPLQEEGFCLNKEEFRDALALRY